MVVFRTVVINRTLRPNKNKSSTNIVNKCDHGNFLQLAHTAADSGHIEIRREPGGNLEPNAPALMGGLVTWRDLFTPAELDALVRHGDSLALEQAGLSNRDHHGIRKTQVAWFVRGPGTEAFYRRMEDIVL